MSAQAKKVTIIDITTLIITPDFLRKYNDYPSDISFFERNFPVTLFPNGLDLSKVKIIGDYEGDYEGYFRWIKDLAKYKFEYYDNGIIKKRTLHDGWIQEYNEYGDIIKQISPDGWTQEYQYVYNDKGTKIKIIFLSGFIEEYIYNKEGTKIKTICSDGDIEEYDLYGNLIRKISSNGDIEEYLYTYDQNGNTIKIIFSYNGEYNKQYIEEYITKYDDKGRLVQIDKCYIEYFDE